MRLNIISLVLCILWSVPFVNCIVASNYDAAIQTKINVDIDSTGEEESTENTDNTDFLLDDDEGGITHSFNEIFNRYIFIISVVYGCSIFIVFILFIYFLYSLQNNGENKIEFEKSKKMVMITGVIIAFLGSIGIVFTILFNLFK